MRAPAVRQRKPAGSRAHPFGLTWLRAAFASVVLGLAPTAAYALNVIPVTSTGDDNVAGTFRNALNTAASDGDDSLILVDPSLAGQVVSINSSGNGALPAFAEAGFFLAIEGNGLILDGALATGNGLQFSAATTLEIRNLTVRNVDLTGIQLTGTIGGGTLANVTVQASGDKGVNLSGAGIAAMLLDGLKVIDGLGDGLALINGTAGHIIDGAQITNNTGVGIRLGQNVANVTVRNSTISDSILAGVLIADGATGNRIGPNNLIDGNTEAGIKVDGALATNNEILLNTLTNNLNDAIQILGGAQGVRIYDNILIQGNRGDGVYIGPGAGLVTVRNNGISLNERNGITVDGATQVLVEANNISSNFGFLGGAGVAVLNGADDVTVGTAGNGNTILSEPIGVLISSATNVQVDDNAINSNTVGIWAVGGSGLDVGVAAGNTLTGNGDGIVLSGSSGAELANNIIAGSSDDGVKLDAAASGTIVRDSDISGGLSGIAAISVAGSTTIGPGNVLHDHVGIGLTTADGLGVYVGPGAGGSIVIDGNEIRDNDLHGVFVDFPAATVTIRNNLIEGHQFAGLSGPVPSGYNSGVSVQSNGTTVVGPNNLIRFNEIGVAATRSPGTIQIDYNNGNTCGSGTEPCGIVDNLYWGVLLNSPVSFSLDSNRISGNALSGGHGVELVRADGNIESNDISGNGGSGVRMAGGTVSLEGNNISGNASWGFDGTVIGSVDLNLFDDEQVIATVRNNVFDSNGEGGMRLTESYVTNRVDLTSAGNDGNSFVNQPVGFTQRWYGRIEVVRSNGKRIPDAECTWLDFSPPISAMSDAAGFCPVTNDDLEKWDTWPLIEQVRIEDGGVVTLNFHGGNPHTIEAVIGSDIGTASYSWDGDTTNDGAAATTEPGYSTGGRLQVARIQIPCTPVLRFMNQDFDDSPTRSPLNETLYLELDDCNLDSDANLTETVAIAVTNLDNGDSEVRLFTETAAGSGVFRATLDTNENISPVSGDGVLRARVDEVAVMAFTDTTVVPAVTVQDSILFGLATAQAYFCNATGEQRQNQIAGDPIYVCVEDSDENSDYLSADAIDASATNVQNVVLVSGGGNNELEHVALLETGANMGFFTGSVASVDGTQVSIDNGVLNCSPGDLLQVRYADPDDPSDTAVGTGFCRNPPTPSEVRLAGGFLTTQLHTLTRLMRDQWFVFEVRDGNQNDEADLIDRIDPGDLSAVSNVDEAILTARVSLQSFDASGARIDWMAPTLTETDYDSDLFQRRVIVSSHFGADGNALNPDHVLYVQPGGRIRAIYVDEDHPNWDPSLGLSEPCPADAVFDCAVIELDVFAPAADAVTAADRFGHPSVQLRLRSSAFEIWGARVFGPADAPQASTQETLSFGRVIAENLNRGDRLSLDSAVELDAASQVFVPQLRVQEAEVRSIDSLLQGQPGDVVHFLYTPGGSTDLDDWAHDTALLCRNVPATIELRGSDDELLQTLIPGEPMTVQIYDADQNQSRTQREAVAVELRSQAFDDFEALNAIETEPDSGVFTVVVPTRTSGDAVPGDRRLRLAANDLVQVEYNDLDLEPNDGALCSTDDNVQVALAARSLERFTDLVFIDEDGEPVAELTLGAPIRVRLVDPDENQRLDVAETLQVSLFNDPERRGTAAGEVVAIDVIETVPSSGIFEGTAGAAPNASLAPALGGTLDFAIGTWFSAAYVDDDDPSDRIVASAPLKAAPLVVTVESFPDFGAVGDAVVMRVRVFNPNPIDTADSDLWVQPFYGVAAVSAPVRLDGVPVALPRGQPWRLPLGRVAAGETKTALWSAVVGPHAKARAHAWAEVWSNQVRISDRGEAVFKLVEEPVFARSTVFLNVFADNNGNGIQEYGETGVPGVRIVSGDGLSVRTDARGQAHFANLEPGPDAFRIDVRSLPPGWVVTSDESVYVDLSPGMLHTVAYGVQSATATVELPAEKIPWRALRLEPLAQTVPLSGSLARRELRIGNRVVPMLEPQLMLVDMPRGAIFLDQVDAAGGLLLATAAYGATAATRWRLDVLDTANDALIKRYAAAGAPPPELRLGAATVRAIFLPGRTYRMQLSVWSKDGVGASAPVEFKVFDTPPRETVGTAAQFGYGEAGLDPQTILALRQAANLLAAYPDARVVIEGFTDDRGSARVNREIGQRRADKAAEYLVLVEGIDPQRIEAIGIGAERFIAPNDSEEGRARNRRVEVSVLGVPAAKPTRATPVLRGPNGKQTELPPDQPFAIEAAVVGERVAATVQFPGGATFAAEITVPPVRVLWQPGQVLRPPAYPATITLEAPLGTTVAGLARVFTMTTPITTLTVPMEKRGAVAFSFYPPNAPATTWIGRVYLEATDKAPPGYDRLDPRRFVRFTAPRPGTPLRSGPWALTGSTHPDARVVVNGRPVAVAGDGSFTAHLDVPYRGEFTLQITATHELGLRTQYNQTWPIERRDVLAVGVLQLSSQYQRHVEHSDGDLDTAWEHRGYGRFYMEGKVRGELLLKARLRTQDQTLEDFLPKLLKYDGPASDLIDPNRTYPVYGDASTSVDEAPGAGPLVLFLGWRDQVLEVGTIDIDERPSQLDGRLETAYGARVHLSSAPLGRGATAPTEADVWGTRDFAAAAQDRIAATGGLVYYLRHTDLQEGSLRLWVEDEDTATGTRYTVRELVLGEDFTVDHLSGRIWLINPLSTFGPARTIVRDSALGSSVRWLVASYRYYPTTLDDANGRGVMITQALGDFGQVGVQYREEEGEGRLLRRGRAWIDILPTTATSLSFEAGRRWGDQQEIASSLDGGLTYQVTRATDTDPAGAYAAYARTQLGRWTLEGYGRHLDDGYGGLRYGNTGRQDAGGLGLSLQPTTRSTVGWRGNILVTPDVLVAEDRVFGQYPAGPLIVGNELRQQRTDAAGAKSWRTDAGLRLTYPIPPRWTVYGEHQQEVARGGLTDPDPRERRSTVGAAYALSTTWSAFLEVVEGNRERGGRTGGAFNNGRTSVGLSYGLFYDPFQGGISGVLGSSAGQQVGAKTRIYGGEEVRHGSREQGNATLAGLEHRPLERLTLSLEGERGKYDSRDAGALERSAVRGGAVGRVGKHHTLEGRGGWHKQVGDTTGTLVAGTFDAVWRTRWGSSTETLLRYRFNREVSKPTDERYASYQEAAVGAAWRPVDHNRVHILSMLRWAEELLTPFQDPDRVERMAIIASVDGAVRVLRRMEVGLKLAAKRSGVEAGGFASDPVHTLLSAYRIAWIVADPFDILGEYRVWKQFETQQLLHGPLAEIGIRPTRWVRFGIGYNFTTFADEMRPHDRFDAAGFRIRLQGLF